MQFYGEIEDRMSQKRTRERRGGLSFFAEKFHRDCGTLSSSVQKRIKDLRSGIGLVLMTAHQPNFFPYSGVLRKAALTSVLATELEERLEIPVVNFFGIADQDFADDMWVRTCQLPAVQRTEGIWSIDVKLPEKLMLNNVVKPSVDLFEKWKSEIKRWLGGVSESVYRLCKAQGLIGLFSASSGVILNDNFESFWTIVEDCYERSEKFSDFNGFVLSKIVNDVWGFDTVFSRFSECQQIFVEEFGLLLSRFSDYSRLLSEAKQISLDEDVGGGVSDQEPLLVPFWYHCDCGSKVKLFLREKNGFLFGEGKCVCCGEGYVLEFGDKEHPDILDMASRISARAIPMSLVFFNGLLPSCYVGGVGGVGYLTEAEHVARGLGIPFPPIAVWRPHDRYLGVGQMEGVLELKRICNDLGVQGLAVARNLLESRISEIRARTDELETSKRMVMEELSEHPSNVELKEKIKRISMSQTRVKRSSNLSVLYYELRILENVSMVFDLIPSIIDYAVNVGLKKMSDQWVRHLRENGDLSSDVHLKSVLSLNLGDMSMGLIS